MKQQLFGIVIFLATCNLSIMAFSQQKVFKAYDNKIIAHRGAWKKNGLPENSIASLKQAIALKCAGSEFDVHITADDSLVINHDDVFQGLNIATSTYNELAQHPLFNGEKIPTLREYITAGMQNNAGTLLITEIKPCPSNPARALLCAERSLQLIHQLGAESHVVYISFDYAVLQKIKSLNTFALTQFLDGNKTPEALHQDHIEGADYHYSVFKKNPDWIAEARKHNIVLNAWTVNTAADMDWLLSNNFDYITTNEPELLAERIEQYKTSNKN